MFELINIDSYINDVKAVEPPYITYVQLHQWMKIYNLVFNNKNSGKSIVKQRFQWVSFARLQLEITSLWCQDDILL